MKQQATELATRESLQRLQTASPISQAKPQIGAKAAPKSGQHKLASPSTMVRHSVKQPQQHRKLISHDFVIDEGETPRLTQPQRAIGKQKPKLSEKNIQKKTRDFIK